MKQYISKFNTTTEYNTFKNSAGSKHLEKTGTRMIEGDAVLASETIIADGYYILSNAPISTKPKL